MTRLSSTHRIARWIRSPRVHAAALTLAAIGTAVLAIPLVQTTPVGQITAAVSAAPGELVQTVEQAIDRQYLGFDTNIYPGDRVMAAWAKDGTYDWVGFYLEAPCHKDDSWSGKRDTLTDMGWGVAVVYVGEQSWSSTRRAKKGSTCSNALLTANSGARDAADAVKKAKSQGFTPGSVIFLDIERVNTVSAALKNYYVAWTKAMLADGRYSPGYYAHADNAARIHADIQATFLQVGDTSSPPFWIAGNSRAFSTDKLPTDVGHTFAAVWQGLLDVTRTHSGFRLPIDINIAAVRSPSAGSQAP